MNKPRACARVVATVLLAGCAAAGAQGPAMGHIAGKLVMEGGPLGPGGRQPGERPLSGTVTFTTAGQRPVSVTVGASGSFSVPLPPGRYQVSGGSTRQPPCSSPVAATVIAGHTATITLTCIVP